MRGYLKYIFSLVSTALVIIGATLYRQNIEVWASSRGLDKTFTNGWKMMTETGAGPWVIAGLIFSFGAAFALWLDFFLREKSPRNPQRSAQITYKFDERMNFQLGSIRGVSSYWYSSNSLVFIEFNNPMKNTIISVATDAEGVEWCESFSTDRYAFINIRGQNLDGKRLAIHFVKADDVPDRRRQLEKQFQNAELVETEMLKRLDQMELEAINRPKISAPRRLLSSLAVRRRR